MTEQQSIKIDAEFKALIPPLSVEEYGQLEANLLANGCRDPLVFWVPVPFGEQTLLDGHNRYDLCQKHGIKFQYSRMDASDIPDRQAAMYWIINNQLGRRNLHPDQVSYLRGKRYNAEKKAEGAPSGNQNAAKQLDQNDPVVFTADRLATEYKVSAPTIKRDGNFAAGIDALQAAGIEPQSVIAHEPKAAVVEFAKLITPEPELPAAPLLPPVAPKPKDPAVASVVNRVKDKEITVVEAVKEIKQSKADPKQLGYVGSVTPAADRDSNDWHTPAKYIEAAKAALGRIDLDPFSSAKANETVQAARFFTVADDALGDTPWNAGTLFMNPPYGKGVMDAAINRFLTEWTQRHFQEAIVLVNNATETQWFQSLMSECAAVCFTDHRIAFVSPDNKQESGNTRGQAFFYFGDLWGPFNQVFTQFGAVCKVIS